MSDTEWSKCNTQVFWGEIAPTDHLVQIYESEEVILDALEGFVVSGFEASDSVIIIATDGHLRGLADRLSAQGYDIDTLKAQDQFIPLNAAETLSKFMRKGWPDEELFMELVEGLVKRARGNEDRRVRAYGEMVALLWAQGANGATVQLEHMWNKFCEKSAFCLFCAYPKSGFTQDVHTSIGHICSTHSKVISGDARSTTEVFYKNQ